MLPLLYFAMIVLNPQRSTELVTNNLKKKTLKLKVVTASSLVLEALVF